MKILKTIKFKPLSTDRFEDGFVVDKQGISVNKIKYAGNLRKNAYL